MKIKKLKKQLKKQKIFLFLFTLLFFLPLYFRNVSAVLVSVPDPYYDGNFMNGELFADVFIQGNCRKLGRSFTKLMLEVDSVKLNYKSNQITIIGPLTLSIVPKESWLELKADNFYLTISDINKNLIINYEKKKEEFRAFNSQTKITLKNLPINVIFGENTTSILLEKLDSDSFVSAISSKPLELMFADCIAYANSFSISRKKVLAGMLKKIECAGYSFVFSEIKKAVSFTLPFELDSELVQLFEGEFNIEKRDFEGKQIYSYKQRGKVAYSTLDDRIKILDGSLEFNGITLEGKRLFIFPRLHDLELFEIGKIRKDGKIIDLRKTGSAKNNAVYIKDKLEVVAANDSTFTLKIDGQQISFENGKVKRMAYPWKSFKVSNTKGRTLLRCYKTACSYGKKERIKINLIPYFARQKFKAMESFYETRPRFKLKIVPFLPGEGLVLGSYSPAAQRVSIVRSEFKKEKDEILIHEVAHAIWYQKIPHEQQLNFMRTITNYLRKKQEKKFELSKEKIIYSLRDYHDETALSYSFLFKIHNPKIIELEKDNFAVVDTIEGWAWIASAIYLNCKGYDKYKFPEEILAYYKGIISEECLEKAS